MPLVAEEGRHAIGIGSGRREALVGRLEVMDLGGMGQRVVGRGSI